MRNAEGGKKEDEKDLKWEVGMRKVEKKKVRR